MKLIVGLGNPGPKYAATRHNIGFMCVSYFGKAHGIAFDKKQAEARVGMGEVGGIEAVLARPQTHMNLSGESVSRLVKRFRVELSDLVVIHDDLDLPLGKVRIRLDGGSGGHKGISSIIERLGSRDFVRVRVGIGRPPGERDAAGEDEVVDFVLSPFTGEERRTIDETIPRVSEALECLLTEGLEAAMTRFNRETSPPLSPSP